MGKNNAVVIDEELWKRAGIDRKTGLPLKMVACKDFGLHQGTKVLLRVKDEQQAVNRYKWNIPKGLNVSSEELERFLYYRGQLCLFCRTNINTKEKEFYILPFALKGTIDVYGRFNTVQPVPFASGSDYNDKNDSTGSIRASLKNLEIWLSTLTLKVIKSPDEVIETGKEEDCTVLLYDYTKQYSENIIPRQILQEPVLDLMSLTVPYLRTNMLASTGVKGVRCGDQDQYRQVIEGSQSVDNYAKNGKIWYPILGTIELQELTEKNMAQMADYMQTLQSIDNLRLSFYGLENGGVFEKKAHTLGKEEELNATNTDLVYEDGLSIRKRFCEIVKHIWNIDISVKENKQQAKNIFNEQDPEKNDNMNNNQEDEDNE